MKKNKRLIIMMASIIMIAAVSVAGTLAWLYTNTEAVTNTFTPAKVGNFVIEDPFNGVEKTNVKVQNSINGDTNGVVDAYIRATYVVNWKYTDTEGDKEYIIPAKAGDYEVKVNDTAWKLVDDYYYYTQPIAPGTETPVFIISAKPLTSGPEKNVMYADKTFTLNVEIVSQSIQAKGVTAAGIPAVEDAWKVVTVNADGTLNVPQNP